MEFRERLERSMERNKSILDRLAASPAAPPEHKRLTTGRVDDGKVDVCSCGQLADLCGELRDAEGTSYA